MTTYPERAMLEKFMIMNFLDFKETIEEDKERVLSIFIDIRKQLDAGQIINNIIVASDSHDTQWLFEIYKKEEEFYYLTFTGTAK